MPCEIRPVNTTRDWKIFLKFPWMIYKGNPAWVPPLLMDMKDKLDLKKNPFYQHAEREAFLAWDGEVPVGRVVALHDHRHNEVHRDTTGFFGFFECLNRQDVADALLGTAEDWCKSRGLTVLRGPVNPSMNDECGLLMDAYDKSPYFMMTYNPPYYRELLEGAGFHKAKDLLAYRLSYTDVPEIPERMRKIMDRLKRREGVVIRPLNMKRYKEELALFKDVYNHAWMDNWGFVPMTDAELDFMAAQLKPLVLSDIVLFAEVKGQVVGAAIAIPDYNQVVKGFNGRLFPFNIIKLLLSKKRLKAGRGLVAGVKKEYRKKGIETLLIAEWFSAGKRLGYLEGEGSWMLEDNTALLKEIDAVGGRRYKTYRMFDRALTAI